MSAVTGALVMGSSVQGCQPGASSTSGLGGGGSDTTSTSTTASNSTTTGTQTTGSTSSTGTGGAPAVAATIKDITTGKVGQKIHVKVTGAVVMSHKFLISQSSSGSCLWGVFLSDPGLTETAANTGILATAYGTDAMIPTGGNKAFCPIPGVDPVGDAFPDDVAPGDVVDVTGDSAYFNLNDINHTPKYCINPGESLVHQFQISGINPGDVTRTSTKGPVPTPHLMAAADVATLASATDKAFHDQWGGVKVRIEGVTSVPQMVATDAGTVASITDQYGHIVLMGSNLQVGDKIYYQGLLKKNDVCRAGPAYANATTTFTQIDGFGYLDFCTWGLLPSNRCLDFVPASDDCGNNTCP
jgi:hypothetical protein